MSLPISSAREQKRERERDGSAGSVVGRDSGRTSAGKRPEQAPEVRRTADIRQRDYRQGRQMYDGADGPRRLLGGGRKSHSEYHDRAAGSPRLRRERRNPAGLPCGVGIVSAEPALVFLPRSKGRGDEQGEEEVHVRRLPKRKSSRRSGGLEEFFFP